MTATIFSVTPMTMDEINENLRKKRELIKANPEYY
jgi:hypothetical protein